VAFGASGRYLFRQGKPEVRARERCLAHARRDVSRSCMVVISLALWTSTALLALSHCSQSAEIACKVAVDEHRFARPQRQLLRSQIALTSPIHGG
jgi:hypothetical protein